MKNSNKTLNVTKDEKIIILIALCNYKYDLCIQDSKRYKQVDKILDKYFSEEDYLL